ncbi:hypothetical protein [Nocardia transvalensis]|uniref:hypothetical protein n=1 Tax=Nocardia transvalensis TaxID=37333 RepID=UPI001895CDB6|nr:hypothetical protein [Nocardia transvalensis]MBF6332104.1 hypothetical protein [Nocardia transvalensis]
MSDSPQSAPGDTPAEGGDERSTAGSGQHQNPAQPDAPGGARGGGHGRHQMPGPAGYPQFEGPGAPQYGSEPVEPPPPMPAAVPPPPPVTGAPPPPPVSGASAPPSGSPGHGSPQGYPGGAPTGAPGGTPPGGYSPPGEGSPGAYPPPGQASPGAYPPPGEPQHGAYPPPGEAQYGGPYPPPGDAPPGAMPPPGWAPPPGAPGYAGQPYGAPAQPQGLGIGRALGYGWDHFRANPIPWIAITLVGFVAYLAVTLVVRVGEVNSLLPVLLIFLAVTVVVWLLQAAMIRGALYETDGTPPDFQGFFGFVNAGNVLLTALIVFAAACVAALCLVFPAIIVGYLCMFSLHFVIDQDQDPFTAVKSSVQLVVANWVPTLLLALAVLVMTVAGALLCGLGLLIAGPVSAIAVTYAYRFLTGRTIA